MNRLFNFFAILAVMTISALCSAQDASVRRDGKAIEILKSMDAYLGSLDSAMISGAYSSDAALPAGLIVSNVGEITVWIRRHGSMHFRSFDGKETKELFIHDGELTLYNDIKNVFARVEVPEDLDAALDYALDEFDIDLPLMDLFKRDPFNHLVEASDSIYYLAGKSRVQEVDCHHIALRTPELDVQIWVQEGSQPVARRIILTYKWGGGAPRFVGNMKWDANPPIANSEFEFKPPEDAALIEILEAQ